MSYIRTKDSVYELKENMTIENGVYSFFGKIYDTTEKHLFINDKDLGEFVSQSENLEELCDLVRFKTKDNATHYIDLHKNTIEDIVVHFGGKNIIIDSFRYCIETDKGLIYVAKLNDKGELVLI